MKINENEPGIEEVTMEPQEEDVANPSYYKVASFETFDLIKAALTKRELRGFLLGSILKYKLRLGYKDDVEKEKKKINWYQQKMIELGL